MLYIKQRILTDRHNFPMPRYFGNVIYIRCKLKIINARRVPYLDGDKSGTFITGSLFGDLFADVIEINASNGIVEFWSSTKHNTRSRGHFLKRIPRIDYGLVFSGSYEKP